MASLPITCAVIDRAAFAHNFKLAAKLAQGAEVIPVIKANAYGHGAAELAKECIKLGAKKAGLARVSEGIALRQHGIKKISLTILGGFIPDEAEAIAKYSLEPSLFSVKEAVALNKAAKKLKKKINVHIKINTGMNRLGIRPNEAAGFMDFIESLSNLNPVTMYTHLPCSDEKKDELSIRQFLLLRAAAADSPFLKLHAGNSAAIARYGAAGLDAVRPGIMLYGSSYGVNEMNLKPVMTLCATVIHTIKLKKGEGVSYGLTYKAKKDEKIAVLSIGYGDGYPRLLSNKGRALINGKSMPILGRVCMDMLMVRADQGVKAGDTAVLIGKNGKEQIKAEELAELSGTISYEIFTGISERVARVYK